MFTGMPVAALDCVPARGITLYWSNCWLISACLKADTTESKFQPMIRIGLEFNRPGCHGCLLCHRAHCRNGWGHSAENLSLEHSCL